ncbi:MAG: hypothetical protein P4L31_05690 [Candidatus Babeliales bacterium]|nr:hypothetical protein [Candidatus Babeliales bacterium]
MNKKQLKVLALIFKNPVQSSVKWTDIESLFENLKAEISEGNGSRVCVALNGIRAVFHRPPSKTGD